MKVLKAMKFMKARRRRPSDLQAASRSPACRDFMLFIPFMTFKAPCDAVPECR